MVTASIKIRVRNCKKKELNQTLEVLCKRTREQKGCIDFRPCRHNTDPLILELNGQWAEQHFLDRYLDSDNFKVLLGALNTLADFFQVDLKSPVIFSSDRTVRSIMVDGKSGVSSPLKGADEAQ